MHGNVVVNQCEVAGLPRDVEGDFIGESAGGGFGDCNSPHPTSTTAAIVVSRRCFISWRFSNGGKSWALLENCLAEIQLVNNPQIVAYGIKGTTTVTPE